MNRSSMDNNQVAPKIEEAIQKYTDIKERAEKEIADIKQQLLDIGVSGTTVAKLKPMWHNDTVYLLRKETKHLNPDLKKAV